MRVNVSLKFNLSSALWLTALFVGLRLGGVTHWQWVWIFAPLWGGAVLGVLVAMLITTFVAMIRSSTFR